MNEKVKVPIRIYNSTDVGLPRYAHKGDSGVDLYAIKDEVIHPYSTVVIPTGIHVAIPDGYELQIRSRSGLALKNGIFVLNSPGTIDGGFRAQIGVILYNIEKESFYINKGDRIAQAVLCPICEIEWVEVEDTDQLDPSERGMGGFGSTGI
jgi:dUTP pyrophosphatase